MTPSPRPRTGTRVPDGALALVRHLARDPEPLDEQAILRDQLRSAYRAQDAGLLRVVKVTAGHVVVWVRLTADGLAVGLRGTP